jgi:hypothetical protein
MCFPACFLMGKVQNDAGRCRAGAAVDVGRQRRTVRLNLPPLPLAGLAQPLNVHLDFDSKTIDEMIDRLTVLRAKMLPASPRRGKRN